MNELSDIFVGVPNDYSIDSQADAREYLTDLLTHSPLHCVSLKHVIKIRIPHYVYNVASPREYSVFRVGFKFNDYCLHEDCADKVEEMLVSEELITIGLRDGF